MGTEIGISNNFHVFEFFFFEPFKNTKTILSQFVQKQVRHRLNPCTRPDRNNRQDRMKTKRQGCVVDCGVPRVQGVEGESIRG